MSDRKKKKPAKKTIARRKKSGVPQIPGCTDPKAKNYNPAATVDDGSCEYWPKKAKFIVVRSFTGDYPPCIPLREGEPIPPGYEKVFGPASETVCWAWIEVNCKPVDTPPPPDDIKDDTGVGEGEGVGDGTGGGVGVGEGRGRPRKRVRGGGGRGKTGRSARVRIKPRRKKKGEHLPL